MQVGCPSDKATYVHRLGRTARAGKSGTGLLFLANFEQFFLKSLSDLPMSSAPPTSPEELKELRKATSTALAAVHENDERIGGQAYQAWMGYYNSFGKQLGWNKAKLVEAANRFATECMELPEIPPLEPRTVGKMGLKGTPGLRIERPPPTENTGGGGGGPGGGSRGGGRGGGRGGRGGGGGGGRGGGGRGGGRGGGAQRQSVNRGK